MKTAVGDLVVKSVNEALRGYNNQLDVAVRAYVGVVAKELVETEFSQQIRTIVHEELAKRVDQTIVADVTQRVVKRIIDHV